VTVTLRFNEGRACDAALRFLEARDGAQRQAVRFPERERHEYPVELACHINGQLYALEHTGIEPFTGHLQVDAEAKRRIQPLVERVAARLPQTEEFELQVPVDGLTVLRGKQLDAVHDTLAEWIERIAPTLPVAPIGRYIQTPAVMVPGVPFPVRLHRVTPIGLPNNFQVNLIVSDMESRRRDRLRKALSDKCPKLAGWKHSHGATRVLILEQNDIQLTNPHIVTETLLTAESEIRDRADEVHLVMSCIDPWRLFPLRVGDRSYFDITNPEDRAWEIDPATLQDITRRPASTRRAEVDR
jgi:hypothetical protein